ncbi:MAG: response regulator [Alcaligenaceae bacterium]|nr:MAG: response regulator [Alcaligenaceae bacterium]
MSTLPLKAILVEDSQTIRDTLLPALEELANTQVIAWATTATDAEQALIEWQGRWQLIIVDLFLAAGSGLDVLANVQSRDSGQYAFVLSNYATAEMRRRCKELGADEVFDKSTEIDSFIARCIAIERTH